MRPAVSGDLGVEDLGIQTSNARPSAFLVGLDQSRVPDHIGDKNCRKPSLDAFFGHVRCLHLEQPSDEIVWSAGG